MLWSNCHHQGTNSWPREQHTDVQNRLQYRSAIQAPLTTVYFFKKGPIPASFIYFRSFQANSTIFTTNQCENMSCPSSIRCRDSNPRPLERESPPITTRPGLPPISIFYILVFCHFEKQASTTFLWNQQNSNFK